MAGYDPYAGHYAHLPGTTPTYANAQRPADDDNIHQPYPATQVDQDPFATPSYHLNDNQEPTWPIQQQQGQQGYGQYGGGGGMYAGGGAHSTGDLADPTSYGTAAAPAAQLHQPYHHQQQDDQGGMNPYLQPQHGVAPTTGGGGGGTYDDDAQAPLLQSSSQPHQYGYSNSTTGHAPGQADPTLNLPGGFDPLMGAQHHQQQQGGYYAGGGGPGYGAPYPPPSPGMYGQRGGGGGGGYDNDSIIRYGRIPQRQPRRYKTVKRAYSRAVPLFPRA